MRLPPVVVALWPLLPTAVSMVPIATDVTLAAKHAAVDVTLAAKEAAADAAAAIVEPAVAAHSWNLLLQVLLPTAMWVATPALQVATPSARMPLHGRMGAVFGPKWLRMLRQPLPDLWWCFQSFPLPVAAPHLSPHCA